MRIWYIVLLASLTITSCSKRNFIYLENMVGPNGEFEGSYQVPAQQPIRFGDEFGITVRSKSPESDALFNEGQTSVAETSGSSAAATGSVPAYTVSLDGNLTLPLIGSLKAVDYTKQELAAVIGERLEEFLQDPVVTVQYLNGKITVLGEVTRPETFSYTDETLTLLQALGMAGDLTVFGDRENIIVLREVNGRRSAGRLNLSDPAILDSPYYFLQSNDVVYVEPIKTKAAEATMARSNISIALSVLSIITIIAVRR